MEIIMVFMEMVKHLRFNGVYYEIFSFFSPISSFSLNKTFDASSITFEILHRP